MTSNEVQFTNRSVHPADLSMTYLWDFGDGVTSTEEDPFHEYARPGGYTVTLTRNRLQRQGQLQLATARTAGELGGRRFCDESVGQRL